MLYIGCVNKNVGRNATKTIGNEWNSQRLKFKTDLKMKYVCPLITVSDMKVARDFYENILDQKVKYDFGESVTFHGDFAIHLHLL